MEAGGGLGGPAHTDVNFGGNPANQGAAPHDWGFAKKNQYLAREDIGHITNHVCPQYFKSKREDVTGQERGQNTNIHLQPWDDKQFELKCPN